MANSYINYLFPDEDFCLFVDYPHQKYIFPIILYNHLTNCTCTLKFLLKNYKYYKYVLSDYFTNFIRQLATTPHTICFDEWNVDDFVYLSKCPNESWFLMQKEICNLENSTSFLKKSGQIIDILDFEKLQQLLFYILNVWIIQIMCFIGFCLNLLIVLVVRKYSKTELKDNFYVFMSLNAKFNCFYCLIYTLNLMTVCLEYNGIFCSSLYSTYLSQFVKIYIINYIGECVKFCSNMTYLFMTLSRYLLINKNPSNLLKKFSNSSIKSRVIFTILSSFLFNLVKAIELQINNGEDEYNDNYPTFPRLNNLNLSLKLELLGIFLLLRSLFNWIIFSLLNGFIEALILIKLRRELKEKRSRLQRLNGENFVKNKKHMESLKEDENRKKKLISMILLNGLINIIFRSSEMTNPLFSNYKFLN